MYEKRYFIVEFEDGLQIIPKNWFHEKDKSKVHWPTTLKNFKVYDAAVEQMKSFGPEQCVTVMVKRIFGSTGTTFFIYFTIVTYAVRSDRDQIRILEFYLLLLCLL